jgi:hypothetical protein
MAKIESEMETHPIEAQAGESVQIKSATKELLLLHKAEAFLLRRIVKARDACDIYVLLQKGAVMGFPAALLANYQVPNSYTESTPPGNVTYNPDDIRTPSGREPTGIWESTV